MPAAERARALSLGRRRRSRGARARCVMLVLLVRKLNQCRNNDMRALLLFKARILLNLHASFTESKPSRRRGRDNKTTIFSTPTRTRPPTPTQHPPTPTQQARSGSLMTMCDHGRCPRSSTRSARWRRRRKRRPRRAFFKIVCGLYEEKLRKDENRAVGNWILARNFLGKIF